VRREDAIARAGAGSGPRIVPPIGPMNPRRPRRRGRAPRVFAGRGPDHPSLGRLWFNSLLGRMDAIAGAELP
jgi:hypothetical protein